MPFLPNNHWGNHFWAFLHTITIIDCENNYIYNQHIKNILINLQHSIPCSSCKYTYVKYLKKLDKINLSKPMCLFDWSVNLHNKVNIKLNKQKISYQTALDIWCKK